METNHKQCCPICGAEVRYNPRYPRYVCSGCAAKASDEVGRQLGFADATVVDGVIKVGFLAWYLDTGEKRRSHECYINGIKCWAEEARFGGIVIRTMEGPP
jgi:hypothetical protein